MASNRSLARDGRIDALEKSKMLRKAATNSNIANAVGPGLANAGKRESIEAGLDDVEDFRFLVADTENAATEATFRVENPSQETAAPVVRAIDRKAADIAHAIHVVARMRSNSSE